MPPEPSFTGRDQMIRLFLEAGFGTERMGRLRCVTTRANGLPAVAVYARREGEPRGALGIDLLRIEEGSIAEVVTFAPDFFPAFGLPPNLEEYRPTADGVERERRHDAVPGGRRHSRRRIRSSALPAVVRLLLGRRWSCSGSTGSSVSFLSLDTLTGGPAAFLGSLAQTGYMIPLIALTRLVAGLLLVVNRFVPIALCLLAPFLVNSPRVHTFLDDRACRWRWCSCSSSCTSRGSTGMPFAGCWIRRCRGVASRIFRRSENGSDAVSGLALERLSG